MTLAALGSFLIGSAGIVILFFTAVMIHEFGHFIFAKLFGVGVERFSLGMGKVLWSRQWGETEYCLSALPIGGYVKLTGPASRELIAYDELLGARGALDKAEKRLKKAGAHATPELRAEVDAARAEAARAKAIYEEHGGAEAAEKLLPGITSVAPEAAETANWLIEDNIALTNKPFHAKFLIFVAGCAMNVLLAAALTVVVLMYFNIVDRPATLAVEAPFAESPLSAYDIRDGDVLVSVNGRTLESWKDFEEAIIDAQVAKEDARVVLRRGEGAAAREYTLELPYVGTKEMTGIEIADASEASKERTSIYNGSAYLHFVSYGPVYIDTILPNQAAEKAGLREGDKIVAMNGHPINTWRDLFYIVGESPGMALTVSFSQTNRETGEELVQDVELVPSEVGKIGIMRGFNNKIDEPYSFVEAVKLAPQRVYLRSAGILYGFYQLFAGKLHKPLEQLGGPVAIARFTYKYANHGLSDYLRWLITINLVLAIMNLLPIPMLDGGHIMFSLFEAIARRPIPARLLIWVYQASFIFIISLAVFLFGNDLYQNRWLVTGREEVTAPRSEISPTDSDNKKRSGAAAEPAAAQPTAAAAATAEAGAEVRAATP